MNFFDHCCSIDSNRRPRNSKFVKGKEKLTVSFAVHAYDWDTRQYEKSHRIRLLLITGSAELVTFQFHWIVVYGMINIKHCYVARVFSATARPFIGQLMVTWHLTMKVFTAKYHDRATLRKLWRQTGNSSLSSAKCWPLLHVIRAYSWKWPDVVAGILARFSRVNPSLAIMFAGLLLHCERVY